MLRRQIPIIVLLLACFCNTPTLIRAQDWQLVNHQLIANYNNVWAFNESEILAICDKGILSITKDGGKSWKTIQTPAIYDLTKVHFIDRMTGWIIGFEGTILKTSDGGESWQAQSSGTTADFYGLYFVDANTGWVVGSYQSILKTTDGGQSWVMQQSGEQTTLLEEVVFLDAQTGFAVGIAGSQGVVYQTRDGGKSWNTQSLGSGWLKDITFIDTNTGWAAGITGSSMIINWRYGFPFGITISNRRATLWRTIDGGSTWQKVAFSEDAWVKGVSFLNKNDGIIWGTGGLLYKTSNGGANWILQNVVTKPSSAFESIQYLTTQIAYTADTKYLYSTSDGGVNWQPISAETTTDGFIYDICFTTDSTGFAAGSYGYILRSIDAGATWTQQQYGTKALRAICFPNKERGFAAGDQGIILRTDDAGLTWEQINAGSEVYWVDIQFPDSLHGWIVGSDGTLLRTTDGGESWQTIQINLSSIQAAAFLDPLNGILVGRYGRYYETHDGGLTWTKVTKTNLESVDLKDIDFSDPRHGWLASSDGTIYSTINGGKDWEILLETGLSISDQAIFVCDEKMVIVAAGGTLYKTEDGGMRWGGVGQPDGSHARVPYFIQKKIGFFCDWDMAIYRTEKGDSSPLWMPVPIAPENHVVMNDKTVHFSWTKVSGATSYHFQISTSKSFYSSEMVSDQANIPDTTLVLPDLETKKYYYWSVAANYGGPESPWSNFHDFLISKSYTIAPILISPKADSIQAGREVTFHWLYAGAETPLSFEFQLTEDSLFIAANPPEKITGTSYTYTELYYNRSYYWRVRAVFGDGYSAWSEPGSFRVQRSYFPAPELLFPVDNAVLYDKSVAFSWTAVEPDVDFTIEISKSAKFSYYDQITNVYLDSTSYRLENPPKDTLFYWRVKAHYPGASSGWSKPRKLTIAASAAKASPVVLFPPENADGVPIRTQFFWESTPGAESFHLQVSQTSDFATIAFQDSLLSGLMAQTNGLKYMTTYYYRIKAMNRFGSSQFSPNHRFQTCDSIWQSLPSSTWQQLNAFAFLDEWTGWAVGQNGTLLQTLDGGDHWIEQPIAIPENLNAICFLNANEGWIAGDEGLLLHTVDGGMNWMIQYIPKLSYRNYAISAVVFTSSDRGWILGPQKSSSYISDYLLYMTNDGGQTWKLQWTLHHDLAVRRLCFIDDRMGYIPSYRGRIQTTKDGGETWSQIQTPIAATINQITFIDRNTGWAVADKGYILKTTDGGNKWLIRESGVQSNLLSVKFIDSRIGWIVGAAGLVLWTSDGGEKWQRDNPQTWADLFDINFVNTSTGYILGAGPRILKTTLGRVLTEAIDHSLEKDFAPVEYTLWQNYPNPFNGMTNIAFVLAEDSAVEITIYDITGRLLDTPLRKTLQKGVHTVTIDLSGYASGILFYELKAGGYRAVHKMALIR